MPLLSCLPIVDKPILFTSLEDACYCGALFTVFSLFDYTVGPLSTLVEYCVEEENSWQLITRYFGNAVQMITLVLFVVSFYYIYGIQKKKRRPIVIFMYFLIINNVALIVYTILLLVTNIVCNDTECDYPNVKSRDVVEKTSIKIILSLFFVSIYTYVLIVAKSYILLLEYNKLTAKLEKKDTPRKSKTESGHSKDVENPPLRINDGSTTDSTKELARL